jgi:fatty-acyl-CoA synthase
MDARMEQIAMDAETTGEIMIRGNGVMKGYYKNPEATTEAFAGGYFHSGDIAIQHPDGYVQITDRAKDVIKSGGEWISSVDLENCACGHPDVLMAAAIGVRHPKWEERPILLVVARQGCTPARDSILAHIAEHFAKWQLPDDVVVVESLPMTATGKISKKDLRTKFRDHLMQAG